MFADATTGWTGGDGTLSVVLPTGETAWLFGDTFLGGLTADGGRDQMYPDVSNTVVVQGRLPLHPLPRRADDARRVRARREDSWYWPNQPVVHGDASASS